MGGIAAWFTRQAPDVAATFRRFPLAAVLLGLSTVLSIVLLNDWIDDSEDVFVRLMIGMASGTAFAVAGSLLAESRKLPVWLKLIAGLVLPVAVVFSLQIKSTDWIVAPLLPFIGVLWMSVAGFTEIGRGDARAVQQDRFWWLNHRAITTGIVAVVGFLVIAIGLFAIDRSLAFLFGLDIGDIFYKFILPIAGVFLTPLYWLSTLPRLDEFSRKDIDEPDFLSRAIGFLGQFVLAPLLVIYALILIAYGVQIGIVGELPQGVLGWMVLVFIITGAANWLVLHPGFMHSRPTVRWFRHLWFWLTIVPIGLYAVAVWVRIDAYGLTEERILLIAGGAWAALLTLAYLTRAAADIRVIPALAGLLLLGIAVGPWNMVNAARSDQFGRLDGALAEARSAEGFDWTDKNAAIARGAINYLAGGDESDKSLIALVERYGVEEDWSGGVSSRGIIDALNIPNEIGLTREFNNFIQWNQDAAPTLVTGTPVLYPPFQVLSQVDVEMAGLKFRLSGMELIVSAAAPEDAETADAATIVPLGDWLDSQLGEQVRQPVIGFERDGISYRLIVSSASVSLASADEEASITFIEGSLAASASE